MVAKLSEKIKMRRCSNCSYQRVKNDKNVSSHVPDIYSFKYACEIITKEGWDAATAYLQGFFL